MQGINRRFACLAAMGLCLLSACATVGGPKEERSPLTIRGELTSRAKIALPFGSVVVVELARAQDGRVVAEQRQILGGQQVPIPFELKAHRAVLQEGSTYLLRGAIEEKGRIAWVSEPVEVIARGTVVAAGALDLNPHQLFAFSAHLSCGDHSASIGVARIGRRDALQLSAGPEQFELRQTPAASGARYEALSDPLTFVWFKGQRATLAVRGETYPECTVDDGAIDAPLRARGDEPSWRLDIGASLRFVSGDTRIEGPAPAMLEIEAGRRYSGTIAGRRFDAVFRPRVCRDGASGMLRPFAVEVDVDGSAYRGCGGDPAALLTGSEWVVEDIGQRMIDGSRVTLNFDADGRVSGRASCNTYVASYTLNTEAFSIGKSATTSKECAAALMNQEQRFLDMLQSARRFDLSETGALVLIDGDGRRITARH
jgi:heat shock protein HslJ/uncharacterized lipoprotein YbaY/membrane-bound inhibitor of C-type lysozyme